MKKCEKCGILFEEDGFYWKVCNNCLPDIKLMKDPKITCSYCFTELQLITDEYGQTQLDCPKGCREIPEYARLQEE